MFALIAGIISDVFTLYFPRKRAQSSYYYAFLVHPRHPKDIFRKFPFLKYLPTWGLQMFERHWWPTTVSEITGLTRHGSNEPIRGFVISIPMTAEYMLRDREHALAQIRRATILARNKGAKIIGLGALTASLSAGGRSLTDIKGILITTGHTYTGYTVTNTLLQTYADMNVRPENAIVAIVGAAGSIGSTSAKLLAQKGVPRLILIDLERKLDAVHAVAAEVKKKNPAISISVTDSIAAAKEATGVITATNAPDALVRTEHIADGTVIVDDAQPSDISEELFTRERVLVLEAGAVRTPGISTNFNMGLVHREDNFCCLAEVLILASHEWKTSTVGAVSIDTVVEIARMGDALNFSLAPRQNEHGLITPEQFDAVTAALVPRVTVN